MCSEWRFYCHFRIQDGGVLIHCRHRELVFEGRKVTHLYLTDNQIALASVIIYLRGELNLLWKMKGNLHSL